MRTRFENVSILSVSCVDAPHRVLSEDLEQQLAPTLQRFGMRADLIRDLSGISCRRFWDEGVMPSEAATTAARQAIEAAELDPRVLGVLVNTSVCRDYLEPSTACIVHGNLGLGETCVNFDLGNACLAFVNGMDVVGNMIERGQVDYGIVVDAETSRLAVETTMKLLRQEDVDPETFRANFATLTLGSGAAAMVLGRSDRASEGHRFLGGVSRAATEHNHLCRGNLDKMETDTHQLLVAGLDLAELTWREAAKELGWTPETIDHVIVHQVSKAHTGKFAERLGLSLDKFYLTFPEYGNIGPASVPVAMCKAMEAGRFTSGDRIALAGIGSGLNCTMAEVRW
jgi:3-oxoacyl-[acyl-carrier-protein] synthase-3